MDKSNGSNTVKYGNGDTKIVKKSKISTDPIIIQNELVEIISKSLDTKSVPAFSMEIVSSESESEG